jgi:DNA (cytosine-5)-methyltransferase 1
MKHLDLFSGIGGFALAAQRTWGEDHKIVSFCEIDKFCQKVLKKHWPDTPIISDIKELKANDRTVELVTGGFPCQPFSVAGKRKGKEDDRYLWPEMVRVIEEFQPRWVIGENVTGIINMELGNCISDLEDAGYDCEAIIIPACAVDAKHRRDRVWILANSGHGSNRADARETEEKDQVPKVHREKGCSGMLGGTGSRRKVLADHANSRVEDMRERQESTVIWLPEPDVDRVDNGVSHRMDRLRALGNAIVPQVAQVIMQNIKEIEGEPCQH